MLHDHTFVGWLTTGMYAATASLCLFALGSSKSQRTSAGTQRFWMLMGIALALLAINKQPDFQTVLIDWLRELAQRDGWYRLRRVWQAAFVAAGIACACGAGWFMLRSLGSTWRKHRIALAGLALLLLHLVMRTADIQRVGEMTGVSLTHPLALLGVEWLSLGLIAAGGWLAARRPAA